MSNAWVFIAVTLLANGAAGLAGGLLSDRWLLRHQAGLVAFAAGAMLAAVFIDVLPEALHEFGPRSLVWAFAAFVTLAVIEWRLGHHHQHDHEPGAPPRTLPAALLVSDALHNAADGAAVAAAFLASPRAGLAVALAVISHELPQEVGDYALLRASGMSRGRALLLLGGVQLSAVIGALGVAFAVEQSEQAIAAVLSIASGTFLYIGATDLLPGMHSGRSDAERRERLFGFLGGIVLIAVASALTH